MSIKDKLAPGTFVDLNRPGSILECSDISNPNVYRMSQEFETVTIACVALKEGRVKWTPCLFASEETIARAEAKLKLKRGRSKL